MSDNEGVIEAETGLCEESCERKNSSTSSKNSSKVSRKSSKDSSKISRKSSKDSGKISRKSSKDSGKKKRKSSKDSQKEDKHKSDDEKKSNKSEKDEIESIEKKKDDKKEDKKSKKDKEIKKSDKVDSPTKKSIFSRLFSCGNIKLKTKSKVTINIENACKLFDVNITNENGFLQGALCNINNGQNYAHFPSKFQVSEAEVQTLNGTKEEIKFGGEKYTRKIVKDELSHFGKHNDDPSIGIGIKKNNKIILVATWKDDNAAQKFLDCYEKIMKNEKI